MAAKSAVYKLLRYAAAVSRWEWQQRVVVWQHLRGNGLRCVAGELAVLPVFALLASGSDQRCTVCCKWTTKRSSILIDALVWEVKVIAPSSGAYKQN